MYNVEMNRKLRTIEFYKYYFDDFFIKQTEKVKTKILWTLELLEDLPRIPENYLKHIEGTHGLYEVRIQISGNIYRIFCVFEKQKVIVLFNGFQEKDQKTPRREINRALEIKREYESKK